MKLNVKGLLAILVLPILGVVLLAAGKPVRAETNPLSISSYTYQTFYAYVEAGETLDASFTKLLASPAGSQITITGPGNVIYSVNGNPTPGQPCPFVVGTCTWTGLTSASAGLWEIKFNNTVPQPVGSNGGDYTWNITVRDGGTAQTGRVFTNLVSLRQGSSQVHTVEVWYQSKDGYLYDVVHGGYGGINSTLVGDNVGVRQDGTCLSGYRNLPFTGYSVPALYECGDPFKIFFNKPDATLPAQAPLPDGTMEWLTPQPAPPTISSITFTGNSLIKRSGDISYTFSSYTGQYVVEVDTNGDGIFSGPLDRSFPQFSDGGGMQTIPFDGNYANGNPIPSTQDINVRVAIFKGGELHFTSADVEIRVGGMRVKVENGNTPGQYLNLYWNDSLTPGSEAACGHGGTTPTDYSQTGRSTATTGAHTWGNSVWSLDCIGQWGNNKTIDDWTYVPLNSFQTLAVAGLEPNYHIRKTVDPIVTSSIAPGQTFTYTIEVENTGDLPLTGISLTDNLSQVLDDAVYNNDVTSGGAGTVSYNGINTISWSGDLAIGATVTIEYSVTMNDPVTGDGILRNSVVSTGTDNNCTANPAIDPECFTITPLPDVTATKVLVGPTNPQAGDEVTYEFTITNQGGGAVSGVSVADDLSQVLDDAEYVDAEAPSGNVTFDTITGRVIWNGNLAASGAAGDSVTVTVTVQVNEADNMGDGVLNNALISSDCPNPVVFDPGDPGYDADCAISTPVEAWVAQKTSSVAASVSTGNRVIYTIQVTNTGGVDLTGLTIDDDLSEVLDDAQYNADETATAGAVAFTNPTISWLGDLDVDQDATITYSVTVNDTDNLGDRNLVNAVVGSMNCPDPAITDPDDTGFIADCVVTTPINIPPAPTPNDPDGSPSADQSSGGLADTGQNTLLLSGAAGVLILISIGIISRRKIWTALGKG